MNEITQKNIDFPKIYNRSYRLAAAVFIVSDVMDNTEEIKNRIKKLSLELITMSVNLKDTNFYDAKKLVAEVEKKSLELMSLLEVASISGLISKMNGNILRDEFQSFIAEISKISENADSGKNINVKGVLKESLIADVGSNTEIVVLPESRNIINSFDVNRESVQSNIPENKTKNGNGHKRKDMRKNTVLEFIKRHNNVSIKDIVPNITGCSEKTIQRELLSLINEGKIKKIGERRWSKYSIV